MTADIIGQLMSKLRAPLNHARVKEAYDNFARTGKPETYVFTHHLPGGDHAGPMTFFAVTGGKGEATHIGSILKDVTKLSKAGTELQQSRAGLLAFFDNVPSGIHLNQIGPGGLDDQTNKYDNDNMGRPDGVTGVELI